MTWAETHRRWAALRDVEAELMRSPGQVPWRAELEDLFGTPAGLVAALRYRWNLRLQAQLDPELTPEVQAEALRKLRASMLDLEQLTAVPA